MTATTPIQVGPATVQLAPLRQWLRGKLLGSNRFLTHFGFELDGFWNTELLTRAEQADSILFLAGTLPNPQGILVLSPLPWESRFFSTPSASLSLILSADSVGEALIQKSIQYCRDHSIGFLSARTYSDEYAVNTAFHRNGFLVADSVLDYFVPLEELVESDATLEVTIRLAEKNDQTACMQLAANAFGQHFGRFHSDPKISREEKDRLYPEWIRSAFAGYADHIVLAEKDNQIAGLTLWKKPSALETANQLPVGHYSLGAVSPQHAGKGVFRAISLAGLHLFQGTGVRFVEGPTHVDNLPVQKAYQRMGFRNLHSRLAHHLWTNR